MLLTVWLLHRWENFIFVKRMLHLPSSSLFISVMCLYKKAFISPLCNLVIILSELFFVNWMKTYYLFGKCVIMNVPYFVNLNAQKLCYTVGFCIICISPLLNQNLDDISDLLKVCRVINQISNGYIVFSIHCREKIFGFCHLLHYFIH